MFLYNRLDQILSDLTAKKGALVSASEVGSKSVVQSKTVTFSASSLIDFTDSSVPPVKFSALSDSVDSS